MTFAIHASRDDQRIVTYSHQPGGCGAWGGGFTLLTRLDIRSARQNSLNFLVEHQFVCLPK